jgi:hypothetical protein
MYGMFGYTEDDDGPRVVVELRAVRGVEVVKVSEHDLLDDANFGPSTHAAHFDFNQRGIEIDPPLPPFRNSIRHLTQTELDAIPADRLALLSVVGSAFGPDSPA